MIFFNANLTSERSGFIDGGVSFFMHPIGQHFVVGFEGASLTKEFRRLIKKYQIGGVILFSRNIESINQLRSLNRSLQKMSEIPLLVGVDQEGGRVARLKKPFTEIPPMAALGKYFRRTKDLKTIRGIGQILGRELKAVGFNWDFAPVVDVHSNPRNPVIGNRSFSPDPQIVAQCAAAIIRGLHQEGVISCVKHFPGHGDTSTDSHKTLPILKAPGRLIWKRDLFPYRRLCRLGLVKTLMTAHVKYPHLDDQYCATLSEEIMGNLLRGRLRYHGVIVSDDFLMKAISNRYALSTAALQFLNSGGDLVMICQNSEIQSEVIEEVMKKASTNNALKANLKKSYGRIQKLKERFLKVLKITHLASPPLSVIGSKVHRDIVKKILGEELSW